MKNSIYLLASLFRSRIICIVVLAGLCTPNVKAQNVNVNPGAGTYPTLKAAFDAVNAGTHTGAITIDIVASTSEPLMAILNASGAGAANYTSVTITTSVGGVTVAGSDTATIKLAGADNVTIDGRIAGTGRNITVSNSRTLVSSSAIWLAHGGYAANDSAGAQNNIIRNLEIACGVAQNTATTNTFGINSGGTTIGNVSGRNNDNNQYRENRIIKCRIGINLNGGSAVNLNDNNIISGNIIGPAAFGADQIGGTGIFVQFQNLCSITNNTVQFVGGDLANTTSGADRVGIGMGINAWTSTSTTTTTGSNNTISGNIIHDIIEERTFSAVGIVAGTTLSGPKTLNLIANNVIYNVRANSTPGDQCVGIGHTGGPGDKIVFNSISMTGDLDPAGTGTASTNPIVAGIAKHLAAAADTAVFIENNSILLDVNTNTTTLLKAAIIGPAVGYAFGSGGLNNNDYYIPTPGTNGQVTGVAGTGTVSFATLALWQAAYSPAQDAASIQVNPIYNSGSFLKPITGSPLVGAGTPVASVPLDIEGITRSGSTPTIGAYENTTAPPPPDAGVSAVVVGTAGQIFGTGGTYIIVSTAKNLGSSGFSVCPVYYRVNGGAAVGPVNTIGPIAPNGTENVTFSGANAFTPASAGTYTIKSWTELPTDNIATNDTFTVIVSVIDPIASFPYVERFTTPTNWTILFENTVGTTALWGLGICKNAFGKPADTAASSNCFNGSSGRVEVLRSPILNLTSMVNPVVHFYSAYRTFTGTECDTLDVLVSTNGGATFFPASTIYKKHRNSTPSLSTRPGQSTSFFPDSAVQWRYETVSLANVAGMNNVIIGFRSHSNFGNRMWVDDVVVTDANNTCTNTFSTPGTYSCDAPLSIQMVTANPASSEMRATRHDAQDPPFTLASPPVATNATATSNNGAIFTPDYLGKIKWWSVSYTGNDETNGNAAGFTTFNISIDVTTLDAITDLDSVYIVRRADALDTWTALATTRSGNILTASGVTLFGDFDIATTASNENPCVNFTATCGGGNVSCFGGNNGFASITPTSGTAPYTYLWSNSNTNSTITGLTAGTYSVTVTDNNGCTATCQSTVTQPAVLAATATSTNASCPLCPDGTVSISSLTGGTSPYSYFPSNPRTGLLPGNYCITVTDANGCTTSACATVGAAGCTMNVNMTLNSDVTCAGVNSGSATATLTGSIIGPWSYQWDNGNTNATANNLTAGNHNVVVTDNGTGCVAQGNITIGTNTTPPSPAVTPPSASITCASPSALLTASGGGTYLWSTGATTTSISVSSANTYTVTVTGANGCTASASSTVTGNTTPPTPTITGGTSFCSGGSTTLDAGSGYSLYNWSTGATTQTINVNTATTVTVTVTDGNGCTGSDSKTTTVNANPTPSITGNLSFCSGGSTTLDAGSGYSLYNWSTGATTQTINVNTATTVTVTVTDGNGCTGSDSKTTTVNASPTPSITGNLSFCSGGSTTLDVGSGYSLYNWSTGETTQTIVVNTATTVTVTVTDGNSCTGSDSKTTTVNANPTPSITGNLSFCSGGSTTLDAGSGYSLYNWSTGETTQTIVVNTATTVTVTVTDGNSCTGSDSKTTTVNASPAPTITGNANFCIGGSTTLDAGSGYSLYNWSTGATTQAINVNTSMTLTVTVTGNNGCTGTSTITVAVNPLIITSTVSNVICRNTATGSINLTVSGGTGAKTYLWNNGSTNEDRSGLIPGIYTVIVTDANSCTASAVFSIIQPATNLALNARKTNVRCGGKCVGLATILPLGGWTPYTYLWTNGNTSASLTGLCAGTYTCTVTDNNGCTITKSVTITQNTPQTVSVVPLPSNQYFASNGGGVGPYTYSWNTSPLQTNQTATIITAGSYKVRVTDSKGCTVLSSAFAIGSRIGQPGSNDVGITVNPNPTTGLITLNVSNCINCNVLINMFDAIGQQVYSKGMKVENNTTLDFSGLPAGIYTMRVMYDGRSEVVKIVVQ